MTTANECVVAIYVDRTSHQWVVRDADGRLWTLTSIKQSWENRQPFIPNDETELESVPRHYKAVLGLPY